MPSLRARLAHDRNGATAIEYAVIAAMLAISLIGALSLFGDQIVGNFQNVESRMPQGDAS